MTIRGRSSRRLLMTLAVAAVLSCGAVPAGAATTPDASSCPSYNPPNALTLVSGTPQSSKLGTAFADPLQVALANTNGCPITTPVAGIAITFAAPGSGPSGTFSSSGSNAALVGANATGTATAPQFTANRLAGGYTAVASSDYGSVGFSLVNTASGVPATIVSSAAASQSATISARYAQPLQVQVLDATGAPVAGASVTFVLGSGAGAGGAGSGAAGPGASFTGGQSQATAITDDSGIATSPLLTANAVAGKFTATAATVGITEPATFALDNLAGKPPVIRRVGAPRLSATVDTGFARRLEVRVVDASGRPLQGESVTFTLGSGGGGGAGDAGSATGSASPGGSFPGGSAQATETTNADGKAPSPRVLANGTAGAYTAVAAVAGVANPAEFSLENLPGKPPRIRALGRTRSAAIGHRYGSPLRVKVTDSRGKPLQGETVTFTLGSGGGGAGGTAGSAGATFVTGTAQATETTNASGIATSPPFAAGTTAGAFTAAATIAGSNASATFQLVNLEGKGVTLRAVTPRLSATVGSRYGRPLEVKLLDPQGSPVQGETVTFALGSNTPAAAAAGSSSAGASFPGGDAQSTVTTNARGIALSPRPIANTTAGTLTATVTVSGSTATAAVLLDNRAGAPARIAAGAAASESTSIGTHFGIPLAVTVTDRHGNPVAGVLVTFAGPGRGAGGSFARPRHRSSHSVRVRTNAAGIAVAPSFVANQTSGGYAVEATVKGAPPAAFGLVNLPPGL